MPVDPEVALAELRKLLEEKESIALVASQVRMCAASQWSPEGAGRGDGNGLYSMWVLLGEAHRLEAIAPLGSPARGRANLCRVLQWSMYGIWARVWGVPTVAEQMVERVEEEVGQLREGLGPSESVVRAFLGGTVPAGAAGEWLSIRSRYRGGLRHPPTHNESSPYHILAPELAWCWQVGQEVGRCSYITAFPDRNGLVMSESAERVLVMLAEHGW